MLSSGWFPASRHVKRLQIVVFGAYSMGQWEDMHHAHPNVQAERRKQSIKALDEIKRTNM